MLVVPDMAVDSAAVGSSRAHLSSLVRVPLLVKAMMPKWTLVVVSSMVTPAVQALESVRTGHTSCSSLPRRVRLGIGLATPSESQ